MSSTERSAGETTARVAKRVRDATDKVGTTAEDAKRFRDAANRIMADLTCPISQEPLRDPVMAGDGRLYEREEFEAWLSRHPAGRFVRSPVTNVQIDRRLLPAVQTCNTIREIVASGALPEEMARPLKQFFALKDAMATLKRQAKEGKVDARVVRLLDGATRGTGHIDVLNLRGCYFGCTAAKPIASLMPLMTSLTSADLSDNYLDAEAAKALAPAIADSVSLTAANLLRNKFNVDAVSMLLEVKQEHPTLTTLCGFKGDETMIDFAYHSLGPADAMLIAPEIGVMASLTTLLLGENDLGPEGAKALAPAIAGSASLTSCDVRYNGISGDGASQLAAAVLSNAKIEKFNEIPIKEMRADSLTTLNMDGKGINVVGGLVVAGLVPLMASLTSLSLRDNCIQGSGEALGEALKTNKSLTELQMSNCFLIAEDGKGLAGGLAVHASLTECNVRGNQLDKESATLLAKVATEKQVMLFGIKHDQTDANFQGQYLNSVDGILIANDLSVSASLTSVSLALNKLCGVWSEYDRAGKCIVQKGTYDATGIIAIADALRVSASLKSVSLASNKLCGVRPFDTTGIIAIADALRVNASLTKLDIRYNVLGNKGKAAIKEAVLGKKGFELLI